MGWQSQWSIIIIFGGGVLSEKRAIIQGWGNVGASAAYFLAQAGVKIVGIIDRNGGLINTDGFSMEALTTLFLNRKGNELISDELIPFKEMDEKIWALDAEIFIPAAASRLITKQHLEEMLDSKLEVIAAGANVPFADKGIFFLDQ